MLRWTAEVAKLHVKGRIHGSLLAGWPNIPKTLPAPPMAPLSLGCACNREMTPLPLRNLGPFKLSREIVSAAMMLDLLGLDPDPRSIDLFQLGALLCRLLTGRSADAYLRSARVRQQVPEVIRPVLDRALVPGPGAWFPDLGRFAADLRAAGQELSSDET